jgi:hypothetical protein
MDTLDKFKVEKSNSDLPFWWKKWLKIYR